MPAYNSEAEVAESVASLVPALGPGREFVVVDDASTDATAAAAQAAGARVIRLSENVGPAEARNRGAAAVSGEILLFIDADVVAPAAVVDRVDRFFHEHPDVAAVFGSYDDRPRAKAWVSQFRNLLHHYTHQIGNEEAFTFWAGCGAVRRAVFEEVGGYDARDRWFSIEDIELGYRIRASGRRIVVDKKMQVTHLKRWTLASVVRTDVAYRALPWTRLILQHGAPPRDLNLQGNQQASLALVACAGAGVIGAAFDARIALVSLSALAAVFFINRRFFSFLRDRRGTAFALASFPLHLLYFLCSGVGFVAGWVAHQTERIMGCSDASAARTNP